MKRSKQTLFRLFMLLLFTSNINIAKASTDPLEVIPLEVVVHISGFLSEKDHITCSKVSKNWREVFSSNAIWQPITRSHYQSLVQSKLPHYISISETAKKIIKASYSFGDFPVYKILRLSSTVIVQEVRQKALNNWSGDLDKITAIDENMQLF